MNQIVIALTPTRARPVALRLLDKWVCRQTWQPAYWYVICDDWTNYSYMPGAFIKRETKEGEGHSLCENVAHGLDIIQKTMKSWEKLNYKVKIVMLEDDDYYCPGYVKTLVDALDVAPLAGVEMACYYNVESMRFRRLGNISHAALAATAFTPEVIPLLREVLKRNDPYVDMLLWGAWQDRGGKVNLVKNDWRGKPLYVGIKGMPGIKGASEGHDPNYGHKDTNYQMLFKWMGRDWQDYLQIHRELVQ